MPSSHAPASRGEAPPERPSYLGLLNSIAVAEHGGHAYLSAWAETTTNPELAAVLHFVSVREIEHHHAFRKRLAELGYDVRFPADRSSDEASVAMAVSDASDRAKWQHFNLGDRRPTDVFDNMFHDKNIDPVTGGLLGRFIAEERDSVRRFAECKASGIVDAEPAEKSSNQKSSKQRSSGKPKSAGSKAAASVAKGGKRAEDRAKAAVR